MRRISLRRYAEEVSAVPPVNLLPVDQAQISFNDPRLIKALLDRRAETKIKAKDNETALQLAGRRGRTEIVRLLKNAEAKE